MFDYGCGFGLLLLASWCVSVACFSYDDDCCLWLIVLILWFLLLEYLCLVGVNCCVCGCFAGLICLLCDGLYGLRKCWLQIWVVDVDWCCYTCG